MIVMRSALEPVPRVLSRRASTELSNGLRQVVTMDTDGRQHERVRGSQYESRHRVDGGFLEVVMDKRLKLGRLDSNQELSD
jgi:hypothetical protein